MKRRDTLSWAAGGLIAAAPAWGQRVTGRVRLGVLIRLPSTAPEQTRIWSPFTTALARSGWVVGRQIEWIERATQGRSNEQAAALAQELVGEKLDLLLAGGNVLAQAARAATRTLPIVAVGVTHPVQSGLVASLARPGGNLTGVATLAEVLALKNLELLRELMPQARRVGVIWNPSSAPARLVFDDQRAAAQQLGFDWISLPVGSANDIEAALAAALRERVQALLIHPNPAWLPRVPAAWGIEHRVAIVSPPALGYLFDLGPDWDEVMQIAAGQIDRLLRGADPATLPMQQPTRFALALNLKTARALGLQVPAQVRMRATEVIE